MIDDCSTDRSAEIVRSYDDPRIKIVRNLKNFGIGYNINLGIEISRGEYIYLMDDDDAILPQTLETFINAAEESRADVIHMNAYNYVGEDFKIPSVARVQRFSQWNNQPRFLEDDLVERLQKNFLEYGVHMTPWIKIQRRDFLFEHQIYYPTMPTSNDVLFNFAELCFAKKIQMIDGCCYLYRMSTNSVTRSSLDKKLNQGIKILSPALKYMREIFSKLNLTRDFQIKLETKFISDTLSYSLLKSYRGAMAMDQIDDLLTELLFQPEQIDPNVTRALIHTLAMKMKG